MHRRTWDTDTKGKSVNQGLQGKPVAELCHAYQISQSSYDQWRDQFLTHASKAFDVQPRPQKEAHIAREHARLNTLVGELTLELKTTPSDEPNTTEIAPGHPAR
jgi:transposase-like protein